MILEQTDYLQQQLFVFLAQLRESDAGVTLVKGLELRQQVIDLILQGQFGEQSDRVRIAQALLERLQIKRGDGGP